MNDDARKNAKIAYTHQTEVSQGVDPASDPALEHQDLASGNSTDRNELNPELRTGQPNGRGPTTHDSLSTVSKGNTND